MRELKGNGIGHYIEEKKWFSDEVTKPIQPFFERKGLTFNVWVTILDV